MDISVLTWNIWFNENQRPQRAKHIQKLSEELIPDFIAYQEVTPDSFNAIKQVNKDYHIIGGPLRQSYDVILLSKFPCLEWNKYPLPNTEMGRNLLIGKFILPNNAIIHVGTFHLESVFPTQKIKEEQLEFIQSISPPNSILMGDTNFLKPYQSLMTDVFVKIDSPIAYNITYSGKTNRNIKNKSHNSRLDRIYLKDFNPKIKSFFLTGIEPSFNDRQPSDHYGIYCSLSI